MLGYEALRNGAAARDLSGRGRILAHGEDNARLLHAMSSNHVQGLEEGQGCYAFFLSAQGRILSDATILRVGADLLIDCEGVAREALFAHLDKFIIADDVTLEDLRETHCEIGIEGPKAAERLLAMGVPVPEVQNGIVAFEGGYVARMNETGLDGVRLILPMGMRAEWLARFEAADEQAWDVVRHEQGKPKFGLEILAKHLVQETRLMHGVHFSKGCYLGQEIVERVRARGAVHKGLAAINIGLKTAPTQDAELCGGGAQAGHLLSAAYSPAEGQTIGFAILGTDYLSGEKHITCNGATATVRASSAFAGH